MHEGGIIDLLAFVGFVIVVAGAVKLFLMSVMGKENDN